MFRKNSVIHKVVVIAMLFNLVSPVVCAKESEMKQKAPIIVNGDKVEYFHDQKKVIGTGNISIDYEDVKLTCDKVTVYLDTREAIAEGNVKVTQKDTYLTGDRMNYNFDKRTGRIIDAYVNYVPFYGKSKDVDKVSENNINIQNGQITTCDLDNPHYRVTAKKIEIYTEDKVVARNIIFYIGNCPIMYLPYYVQPLKEESAHVTIQPGHDSQWGYYALTSMRYDYNQYFHGRYRLDYRTANGLGEGVDNDYELPGAGKGTMKFYYTHEDDALAYQPSGRAESKYRFQVRHEWQINDDTLAIVELNKVRDDNFMKYYFLKEFEEQRQPDNYVSVITTKPSYTTTFLARTRLDKYFDVVQRLPEYDINIPKYNIKYNGESTPVYYDQQTSAVYLNHAFRDNPSIGQMQKDLDVIRLDDLHRVSYAAKLFKSLNVTPFADIRQTYYSRNKWGDTNVVRGIFDTGLDSSMKFYRTYDVNTNFMNLDIHKLRHIITPTVSYQYSPSVTVSPDNLNQFDDLDSLDKQNHALLAIENKLQTKRMINNTLTSVDIVDFIIQTDYQFRLKKDDLAYKNQKFKSVDMQLELTPYPWLYALSKMRVNTNKGLPDFVSIDFVGGKDPERSLALGYRYENSFDPGGIVDPVTNKSVLNYLTADAMYRINETWKVRGFWRFNMDRGYIDEQEYTIYRDLHCWILEFTYDFQPNQDTSSITNQTFWIALRLKAFPKTPLGLRRSYSRTKAGSPGDLANKVSD